MAVNLKKKYEIFMNNVVEKWPREQGKEKD